MADYWKSQPRKFCDFCKCWIADNKPSRDFHERGKRHQESVAKRISELRKKGFEHAKNEKDAADWMVQMEKEAMKKLREDLTADPSLASQYGVKIKSRNKEEKPEQCPTAETGQQSTDVASEWQEALSDEGYVYYWNAKSGESRWELPESDNSEAVHPSESVETALPKSTETKINSENREKNEKSKEPKKVSKLTNDGSLWQQLTSPEGYPYYWNTQTSEVRWELPATCTESDDKVQPEIENKNSADSDVKEPCNLKDEDVTAKEISSSSSTENCAAKPATNFAESSRQKSTHGVYGEWQELKKESEPLVDLELPVDQSKTEMNTFILSKEPKVLFKEKTVGSLGVRGMEHKPVEFKKRKLNSAAAKGNVRRANYDEDL